MKPVNNKKEYQQGVAFAILCAVFWGFLPIYWKYLEPISPFLILFYRIALSFLMALILALIIYKRGNIIKPLKEKGILLSFFFAGILISFNWGLYIWAVNNDHVIQTSIGYYIEPLIICVLGMLLFKEKMNGYKLAAFLLACAGVAVMLAYHHRIPSIALLLAFSFASYTAIKKKMKLDAVLAQVYETMFQTPLALIVIVYYELTGKGAAANGTPYQWAALALVGVMTCVPLILFAMAANRISMVTLGVSGYISPSITLVIGIFLFREPFDKAQFLTFAMIWIALAVFTAGEIKESRKFMSMTEDKTKTAENRTDPFKNKEEPSGNAAGPDERFRFAAGIKRVTAGTGGEALLIAGSEKTALIDCGMAYCGDKLADNIKKELGERPLDYVILTHTHYDHIGGLPYLRAVWPGLVSFGARYGKRVLEKESALEQIRLLSEAGWKKFSENRTKPGVLMDGLRIDRVIREGDVISLGDREIHVYETPGHTNCSLTLLLEPGKILFPSESSGVYTDEGAMLTGMLKSCRESIVSIGKCRKIEADQIISPHYGLVPEYDREAYWDLAMAINNKTRDFILKKFREGLSHDEILKAYTKTFYVGVLSEDQPKEAFLTNAGSRIKNIIEEFAEYPDETD